MTKHEKLVLNLLCVTVFLSALNDILEYVIK